MRVLTKEKKLPPKLKTMKISYLLSASFLAFAVLSSCDKNGNLNVLSLSDDLALGAQSDSMIRSNPTEFPILSETQYPQAYAYVNGLKQSILNSGKIDAAHKEKFVWKVTIINKDILNAFVTPGGYIYVYTGLIKYLDNGDQLAGVMGHEMGHADLRHSSRQITKQQGLSIVSQVVLGQASQGTVAQVLGGLIGLKFTRDFEREADDASVNYLSGTRYDCDGAAGFFKKIGAESEDGRSPEWLSTHPNPENRVAAIEKKRSELNCDKPTTVDSYQAMKAALP